MFVDTLPMQAVFTGIALLAILLHKLTWTLSNLLITGIYISPEEQNSLAQYARKGLVGQFIGFVVLLATTALKLVFVCMQSTLMLLYAFLPFVIIAVAMMALQQRWGDSAVMLTSILNDPSTPIGETIHIVVQVPLQILSALAYYVLPIYNLLVYVVFNLPLEIVVHFFLGNGAAHLGAAVSSLAQSFPLLAASGASYVQANQIACSIPQPTCLDSQQCLEVDAPSIALLCLDPQTRSFSFQEPLMKWKDTSTNLAQGIAIGCGSLKDFINVFMFPITDPQLWNALGAWLNAVLYAMVGAPTTTVARCALAGGFSVRPAMCTPDFGPAFDFAVSGLRFLGSAIDNFVNMAFLIVAHGADAQCPSSLSASPNNVNFDWALDPIALSMFGSNSTVLVSLSSSLVALTDGSNALFIKHASDVRRSYYPLLWAVNPRFGVAALQDGVSMLGCRCLDADVMMVIQCTTVTQQGQATMMNASWELQGASTLLRCAAVRVLVQSVRWPEHRVLFAEQLGAVPPQQVLAADAAIYVIPSCGGKASNLLACLDPAVLTLSNCFPFCMALHFQQPSMQPQPLVLRGYNSWSQGVLVTGRDCVPLQSKGQGGGVSSSCSSDAASTNAPLAQTSVASASADEMVCSYSSICSSWVVNKSTYVQKDVTGYHVNVPVFADTEHTVALVLQGQPLVAAGGVVMRQSRSTADLRSYVDFPMLTGLLFEALKR